MEKKISRRRFVKLVSLAGAGVGLMGCGHLLGDNEDETTNNVTVEPDVNEYPPAHNNDEHNNEEKEVITEENEQVNGDKVIRNAYGMPMRRLGNLNVRVSLLGLGGSFAIAQANMPDKAAGIVERALDLGINYIDTAPSYGASESNIGQVMKYRRSDVFLATKTGNRNQTYDETMRIFEQSLQRLQTDYIDLCQIHGVHTHDGMEKVLGEQGAARALNELKEQGVLKYTGITGHRDPDILTEAIKRQYFDCVLLPLNAGDIHQAPFQKELLDVAGAKGMGIIAMKVAAYGRLLGEGIINMEEALNYVFSFPVSTAIVGISHITELEEDVRIAKDFAKLSLQELQELEQKVKPYTAAANFFKTEW